MRFIHQLISCLDFRTAGIAACVPAGAAEAVPHESVLTGQPGHILAPLGFLLHSNRQDATADDAAAGVPKTSRYRDDRFDRPPAPATGTFAFTQRDLRVLLIVILAIAAFLRFYALPSMPPGLFCDEGMDGSDALAAIETHHFDVFYPEDNGREGLYVNLAAVCVDVLGNKAWVLRLPAALFGLFTVLGVYLLVTELISVPTGLLAAFFIATSFWHINFSRIAFRAIAAPFFLAWALYLMLVAFRRLRERRPYIGWMALAGFVYSLGFYTYIAYRATPVVIGLVLLHRFNLARKENWLDGFWKAAAVLTIATVLVAAPLAVYFVQHTGAFTGRAAQVSVFEAPHPVQEIGINFWKTVMMLYTRGDSNWRHNYGDRPEVYWPVAAFMTLGFLIAIGRLISGGKDEGQLPYLVALSWLFVGAMPAFLSDEGVPHALRAILMVPAVFLLAAIGARSLYAGLARIVHNGILPAAATVVLLALTYEAGYTYFVRWAENPIVPAFFDIGGADLAKEINAYPRNLPKVVAVTAQGISFHRLPMPVASVMYLTKTYTDREQAAAHIRYYTPDTFERPIPPELQGRDFCEVVTAMTPGVKVFCMR
ncbi:MAG: glycosyltransferase family 39 protein [Bryobacteraceae bacterium]